MTEGLSEKVVQVTFLDSWKIHLNVDLRITVQNTSGLSKFIFAVSNKFFQVKLKAMNVVKF
jgi:hypothetical protein